MVTDLAGEKNKVTGGSKVAKNLQNATRSWENSVVAGLYLEANNVMNASLRKVPVDLGTLKASGYVTLPRKVGNKTLVEMGYGGNAKDYAVVQHERLDFNHPEGGEAKYLESVVDERTPVMAANILALAKAHFEQGGLPVVKGTLPTDPNGGGE